MKSQIDVRFQMAPGYEQFTPIRHSDGASGLDLHAAITNDVVLQSGERQLVPTGLRVAIPEGYEAQVRPRSGLAIKHGITVLNSPGTIDSDFRGEIGIILFNCGTEPFRVRSGDRVAQLVFAPVVNPRLVQDELDQTTRGEGGFGSTEHLSSRIAVDS